MGGVVDSVGGFLGLSSGPSVSAQTGNGGLDQLNSQLSLYGNQSALNALNAYANGTGSSSDALNLSGLSPAQQEEMGNALATGATTGSKYATEQVQNNPILGQLFANNGQLSNEIGQYGQQSNLLNQLETQGFQLQPQDQTLYGEAAGNISRLFGQQENAAAQDLANRGLSVGPSGAALATFSGLQGNKNEMLANAQTQIMNQRVQDTLQRIGQTQQFMSSLGGNINNMGNLGANAINQQYGRQATGAAAQHQGLTDAANTQINQNATANSANVNAANFNASHKPANFMDYADAGMGSSLYNVAASPGTASQTLASGGGTGSTGMGKSLFAGFGG